MSDKRKKSKKKQKEKIDEDIQEEQSQELGIMDDDPEESSNTVASVNRRKQQKDQVQEKADETVYDINPIKVTCKHCYCEIVTFVQHEMNPFFPLFALLIFFVFGYMGIIICPLQYLVTQNAVHRCSRCLQTLGIKKCFGVPDDLNAPIWHVRLGKCAIVLERVWAILILLALFGFSTYYVATKPYAIHHSFFDRPEIESRNITRTWNDYLEKCSGEKIMENQVHALHEFSQIYENNIVEWDGYYIDTKKKDKSFSMFGNEFFMSILVKMDPSESENFADVVLSISQDGYKNNKEVLDNLLKGDHLIFKGIIKKMGNEFKLHHLHLLDGNPEVKTIEDTGHTKDLEHIEVHESRLP